MTDLAIRSVSLAESAQRAARLAADTFERQPNPHDMGTDEFNRWQAAYDRWYEHFMQEDDE